MNIIYGEVGSGKTKKLIQESSDTGAIIVTANEYRAKRLKDKAEAYSIPIIDPISWKDVLNNKEEGKTYLIDDLDEVLEDMFQAKIKTVTLNKENELI